MGFVLQERLILKLRVRLSLSCTKESQLIVKKIKKNYKRRGIRKD